MTMLAFRCMKHNNMDSIAIIAVRRFRHLCLSSSSSSQIRIPSGPTRLFERCCCCYDYQPFHHCGKHHHYHDMTTQTPAYHYSSSISMYRHIVHRFQSYMSDKLQPPPPPPPILNIVQRIHWSRRRRRYGLDGTFRSMTTVVNTNNNNKDMISRKDNEKNSKNNDSTKGNSSTVVEAVSNDVVTTTPPTTTGTKKTRGIPLKDVIPKYIRLKFCANDDTEAIESDNEFDYSTYTPENDPDLTQYIKPYYHGPNMDYDFTPEEMDQYLNDPKVFQEMIYNMLHRHRSRSTPSVKRAHHAWWTRTKQLQIFEEAYQTALRNNNNDKNNKDEITRTEHQLLHFQRRKHKMIIDEYASDDGTCIDYYSTECQWTISAIRECAIHHYSLPSDQELPLSLIPPDEITTRTYDEFVVLYYDALHTQTWHPLINRLDVMYYVNAERAIPIHVPKEYHKYVVEDDPDHWNRFRYDTMINEQRTLDPFGIGDKTITNQERGRRIAAWIRQHPTKFGPSSSSSSSSS